MNNNGALLKSTTLFQIPFSLNSPVLLHSNNKTHHQLSFVSVQFPTHKLLSFHLKSPSGSPLLASKTPIIAEPTTLATENFDLDDEFEDEFDDEFEDEEEEEEEEEDDDEIIVPLRNMREWTRNKPLGFGEGKVYDTSVEDKLLEELEQSKVAQIANINNLKKNPEDGNPKKENLPKQKVPEVPPNGIRVRLINLPKKKNIHRDLQLAFKPFSGIVNIIPAVLGNEKTREPVCKGFAFVDFKSEKEANSVYKGYSMPKGTEAYLQSHGLKDALYSIRAVDLTEELFGRLVPCLFQHPPPISIDEPQRPFRKLWHHKLGLMGLVKEIQAHLEQEP
ncbi:uncharacterized protein [Rutidosis leptorrhynchoides]|uniref:uncharacterized protein isoform X2 n=1 Tax=Rutidosis leptorrhynchoides TaxID=125765 RepID=UPI003A993862